MSNPLVANPPKVVGFDYVWGELSLMSNHTFLRISSALDIKLRDLFDFDHQQDKKELREIIISAANNAPEEEL